jgi:Zn ribbon nucleic-acid-binding protein
MNPLSKEKSKTGTWRPPSECVACGADESHVRKTLRSEKVAHGETFLVSHQGYECCECGFAFLGPEEMDEAVRAVLDAYHKKHFPYEQ